MTTASGQQGTRTTGVMGGEIKQPEYEAPVQRELVGNAALVNP
jgi:hypothetical protein